MRQEKVPTREALFTRYTVRALKRTIKVVVLSFALFVIVMAIVWAVPKIWRWALG